MTYLLLKLTEYIFFSMCGVLSKLKYIMLFMTEFSTIILYIYIYTYDL